MTYEVPPKPVPPKPRGVAIDASEFVSVESCNLRDPICAIRNGQHLAEADSLAQHRNARAFPVQERFPEPKK